MISNTVARFAGSIRFFDLDPGAGAVRSLERFAAAFVEFLIEKHCTAIDISVY
jgi:hypothetical protein